MTGPLLGAEGNNIVTKKAPKPPAIFDELDDAVAEAKESNKQIFVACLKRNDPDCIALGKMIEENTIYLDPDKLVVFRYHVAEDELIETFRSHFGVTEKAIPIVVIADAWGKPLAHRSGPMKRGGLTAWVQKTGGADLVDIPPDSLFNVKSETLVTRKEIIDMRTWTFISGKRIYAALVEANGTIGTFRTDDDDYLEVDFNHLIAADKDYLSRRLPNTTSAFP
jgi:hypothetical protein